MNEEILIEEGIVTRVSFNEVEISLIETDKCETCSTKDFCIGDRTKAIILNNEYNLKVGDRVKIEVRGKTILQTVILLYGIPLLILIASFLLLYQIIEKNRELIVSSISFLLIGIYYLFIASYLRSIKNQFRVKVIKEN